MCGVEGIFNPGRDPQCQTAPVANFVGWCYAGRGHVGLKVCLFAQASQLPQLEFVPVTVNPNI